MSVRRTVSPRPRPPLPKHELVTECRSEGAQDLEVRVRTLEAQRDMDHAFMVQLSGFVEGMNQDFAKKDMRIEEVDGKMKEFTMGGLVMRRDVEQAKGIVSAHVTKLDSELPKLIKDASDAAVSEAAEQVDLRRWVVACVCVY